MKKITTTFVLALLTLFISAQSGMPDMSFNPNDIGYGFGSGAQHRVFRILQQDDGKILLAGSFTWCNGTPNAGFTRLHPNGEPDHSFNVVVESEFGYDPNRLSLGLAMDIQSDGKILIGGLFKKVNGLDMPSLARLNSDGSLDTGFNPGSGIPHEEYTYISAIKVLPDGKILVAGTFSSFNDEPFRGIVRLHPNGEIDHSFQPPTDYGSLQSSIFALEPMGDKILVGGGFCRIDGTEKDLIARLNSDGSLDTTFVVTPHDLAMGCLPSITFSQYINAVALTADNMILVGGHRFGLPTELFRLHENGLQDTTFAPNIQVGDFGSIQAIIPLPDGKILVGFYGYKFTHNGIEYNGAIRLTQFGDIDTTFRLDVPQSAFVYDIAVLPDGGYLFAGDFETVGGIHYTRNYIKTHTDGTVDESFVHGSSANHRIHSIAATTDGKLYVAGDFHFYNGMPFNGLLRINADGSPDASFNPELDYSGSISKLAVQNDGRLLIAGSFVPGDSTLPSYIARLKPDGSHDESFMPDESINAHVQDIVLQPDQKIVIAGVFGQKMIRLNPDGSLDQNFNAPGFPGSRFCIELQEDGKVLLGSAFPFRLKRYNPDGSADVDFNDSMNSLFGSQFSLKVQPDGKILVGGWFQPFQEYPRKGLYRILPEGVIDTSFHTGFCFNKDVYALALQDDGKIIVAGNFSLFDSIPVGKLVRLNADGSLDHTFTTVPGGTNGAATSLLLQHDGLLYAAGEFTSYHNIGRNYLTRIFTQDPDGIIETSLAEMLEIYPNPAKNQLTVAFADSKAMSNPELRFYNMLGTEQFRVKPAAAFAGSSPSITLNVESWPAGLYIVALYSDGQVRSRGKVIVQP